MWPLARIPSATFWWSLAVTQFDPTWAPLESLHGKRHGVLASTRGEAPGMTTGPPPRSQLLDYVLQSWTGRPPTMPRKPLVRTSLLNANPVHPFALVTWRCFVPPLHPRQARDQAVFWRFPTCPRRGHDTRLTTDSVASSSLCGSRAGLHSAGGAATNTGDRELWE